MAFDTINERFGMIGLGLPVPSVLPFPDGSLDNAADRRQLLWLYPGTLVATGYGQYFGRYFAPRYFAPRYWPSWPPVDGPYGIPKAEIFPTGQRAGQAVTAGVAVGEQFVTGQTAGEVGGVR